MSTMKNYISSIAASEVVADYCRKQGLELNEKFMAIVTDLFVYLADRMDLYEGLLNEEDKDKSNEYATSQKVLSLTVRDLVIRCAAKQDCIDKSVLALKVLRDSKVIEDEAAMKILDSLILVCESTSKL